MDKLLRKRRKLGVLKFRLCEVLSVLTYKNNLVKFGSLISEFIVDYIFNRCPELEII